MRPHNRVEGRAIIGRRVVELIAEAVDDAGVAVEIEAEGADATGGHGHGPDETAVTRGGRADAEAGRGRARENEVSGRHAVDRLTEGDREMDRGSRAGTGVRQDER